MEQSKVIVSIVSKDNFVTNVNSLTLNVAEFKILNSIIGWMQAGGFGSVTIDKGQRDYYDLTYHERQRITTR